MRRRLRLGDGQHAVHARHGAQHAGQRPPIRGINGDTLDSVDRSGYAKLLNEVVVNLTGYAVHQTSPKYAVAADTADGCVARDARRLDHMRNIATMAAAQQRNMRAFGFVTIVGA